MSVVRCTKQQAPKYFARHEIHPFTLELIVAFKWKTVTWHTVFWENLRKGRFIPVTDLNNNSCCNWPRHLFPLSENHIQKSVIRKHLLRELSPSFLFLQQHSSHTQVYCHLPGKAFKSQSYCRSKDSWKIHVHIFVLRNMQKNINCGCYSMKSPWISFFEPSSLLWAWVHWSSHLLTASLIRPLLLYQPLWKLPTFQL